MLVFVYRKYFLYKKYRNTIFCLCVCFLVICFFYVPSQLPMVEAGASKKGQLRLRNAGEQGDLRALPAVLFVQVVPSFTVLPPTASIAQ